MPLGAWLMPSAAAQRRWNAPMGSSVRSAGSESRGGARSPVAQSSCANAAPTKSSADESAASSEPAKVSGASSTKKEEQEKEKKKKEEKIL